jgi:hypothetical protein
MKFEVTYLTSERPTDLPDGAVVKEVPLLPLILSNGQKMGHGGREIEVRKSGDEVSLRLRSSFENVISGWDRDQAREIAHALLEAVGDAVPVISPGERQLRLNDVGYGSSRSVEVDPSALGSHAAFLHIRNNDTRDSASSHLTKDEATRVANVLLTLAN